MIDKSKIKVVKRSDERVDRNKARNQRKAARKMVTTVTEWVTDLNRRKNEEAKAAIDLLLGSRTRPSEL